MAEERRSRVRIKKHFQKQFIKLIVTSMVVLLVVALAAVYAALRLQIARAGFSWYTEQGIREAISWLNWFLPLIAVVLAALSAYIGTRISFKVAGPLYALEKQLHMVNEGETDSVQLRGEDEEMIPLANLINELIQKREIK